MKLSKLIPGMTTYDTAINEAHAAIIDIDKRVTKIELIAEYFFAKETNPERAAEIVAQIYGDKQV